VTAKLKNFGCDKKRQRQGMALSEDDIGRLLISDLVGGTG
jgi:hypothetical protein